MTYHGVRAMLHPLGFVHVVLGVVGDCGRTVRGEGISVVVEDRARSQSRETEVVSQRRRR